MSLLPGDGLSQNLGVRVLIGQMLRSGQLPLWNPYILAGAPLLASVYPGALYPPNWVFALFSPATAMNIVVVTTYHLALIGAYLYGRRIGLTRIAATVAYAEQVFLNCPWRVTERRSLDILSDGTASDFGLLQSARDGLEKATGATVNALALQAVCRGDTTFEELERVTLDE